MIDPKERQITGNWRLVDGRMVGDVACERVQQLIATHLVKLGCDWSGWETLYRDPNDGRYWEMTYPKGEWHGGGPPRLQVLSADEAARKYDFDLSG